jgi:hypothetical protein
MLESFTSSTGGPCVAGNQNVSSVLQGYQDNQYSILKYQVDFPGTGDPYYTDEVGDRRIYYNVNSVPDLVVDGNEWQDNSSSLTNQIVDNSIAKPSFIDLSSTYSVAGPTVNFQVTIDPLTDFTNLTLYAAIFEYTTFNNIGTNGETQFYYVMKKMVPGSSGFNLDSLQNGTQRVENFSYTFIGGYILPPDANSPVNHTINHTVEDFNNLGVVVWVQDDVTKEILQSTVSNLGFVVGCNNASTDSVTSCSAYTWIDGNTYTSSNNTATYTLINAAGCDSIVTLNLTTNAVGTDYQTTCGSYTWVDGNTYYNSTMPWSAPSYTVQNAAGCDSIITLDLTINPNQFNADFTVNQTLFTTPPFAAQFTNTTPNPSNYNFTWDFSDGTILQSNNASVFHQFLNNGLYDVTLIAENILTGCTDTMFKNDFIFCSGGTSCTHASTINQTGPITACLSDSIFLTCNTDPTFSYQWRLNGTYIPGAVDTFYYPTQSGNYSVLISQNGCPEVSSDISVTVSPTPNPPFITSSGSFVPCQASFVTLSVPNNFATYSWSSGGTASTEVITSSGSYFVTVTNIGGCASTSLPFNVNASFVQPPDVCIVGVTPQTNFNRVVWEHPNSTAIDSFYVYKETNQANIYQKIGGTAYNDTAVFDDVSSNPAVQAYRYKLSSVDSCGVESDLGDFHKTIHLTINQGIGSAWNLIWSGYEGFTYPSYNIYRGFSSSNMVLLTTIASNLNSYTDLTAPAGQLYYQIEVVSSYTCDPSRSFNSSRSNIVDNGAVSCINAGIDIQNACDSYTWIDGNTYNSSNNTATVTLTNAAGCDSVVTLNLTINQTSSSIDNQILCDGNTLNWIDGNTYTSSNNTATYTLTNTDGCDSIVTLNLTVSSSTSTLITISSCNSYIFNGQSYTSSGIYVSTSLNAAGCPRIDSLDLTITSLGTTTVQSSCDSFLWNGTTYDTSGIYTSNSSGNCVDTLVLTIFEFLTNFAASPTSITSPPFIVTFNNTTPNISNYDFTWDLGDGTIGQTNIPSFVHQYMSNGIYDVSLIAEDITNGCGYDTLKFDNLISCSGGSGTSINEKQQLVNIYPNPTKENITICINNYNGNIQTEVYDLIGNRLQTTNETTISLEDYARGIYILKVAYGYKLKEVKVIKQ